MGEVGSLAQLHDRGRAGTAAVGGDVLLNEPVGLGVDVAGAAGEVFDQRLRHAGDLPGGVSVASARASFPVDAEGAGEVVAEDRLVEFGGGDRPGVQRGAVDGAPLAVTGGLDPIADHHVCVQVRVVRAGVVMVERGGDDAGDVELRDTSIGSPGAAAGRNDLALQEFDRFGDGEVVGVGDDRLRPGVGDSPEHAGRLREREREVVAGDRVSALALLGHLVRPVTAAEILAGDRMPGLADQQAELLLGHFATDLERAVQACDAGAHPPPRRGAFLGVVARQRRRK